MKKITQIALSLCLATSAVLFSCEDKMRPQNFENQITMLSIEEQARQAEVVKVEFSKALAQALTEKEVRAFLKEEALQKFDGDYDVLYAFVKDKKLTNGKTFEEVLTKYSKGNGLKRWSEKVPLMTIYVPNITGFSPESWNLDSQIPDVVIDNSHLKERTDQLVTFSSDLHRYEVNAKKAPTFPVIVVKENERIIAKSKLDGGARKTATFFEEKSTFVIKENDSNSFYFIGDVNPNKIISKKDSPKSNLRTNSALNFFVEKMCHFDGKESQRDWIYYRTCPSFNTRDLNLIANGGSVNYDWNKGVFANYYTEKLTGFRFNSALGIQAVSDEWTEGYLEFHVIVSFIHRDGGMTNDLKVFFCTPDQLMDGSRNPVNYDPDVELMPWDIYRYGDEWKLSVLEHDAGGSVQKTISSKSTFGLNFDINATIFKIGLKFGTSATFEKSNSTVVNVTSESDDLGDARFLFDYTITQDPCSNWNRKYVGTGAVDLSIEPILTSSDSRPWPYID